MNELVWFSMVVQIMVRKSNSISLWNTAWTTMKNKKHCVAQTKHMPFSILREKVLASERKGLDGAFQVNDTRFSPHGWEFPLYQQSWEAPFSERKHLPLVLRIVFSVPSSVLYTTQFCICLPSTMVSFLGIYFLTTNLKGIKNVNDGISL